MGGGEGDKLLFFAICVVQGTILIFVMHFNVKTAKLPGAFTCTSNWQEKRSMAPLANLLDHIFCTVILIKVRMDMF